jgi:hypothetical protein
MHIKEKIWFKYLQFFLENDKIECSRKIKFFLIIIGNGVDNKIIKKRRHWRIKRFDS